MHRLAVCSCAALFAAATVWGQGAPKPVAVSPQAIANQYCAYCHNDKLKTGGVTLTKLDWAHPGQSAELGEKVVRMVRAGMMPPPGMPRPKPETSKVFAGALESGIDQAAADSSQSRPAGAAPPESHRIRQFDSRSAGSRRGCFAAPAQRRHEPRLRQHGRRAHHFAGADGRLHPRGRQDQPRSGRRSRRAWR